MKNSRCSNYIKRTTPPPVPSKIRRKKKRRRTINRLKQIRNLSFLVLILLGWTFLFRSCFSSSQESVYVNSWAISDDVYAYEPALDAKAVEYGISDYEDILLCIMQVESAGLGNDVMQASESLSLPLNTLNPEESIEQGVSFFASLLSKADRLGLDLNSVIQAYNYGSGFLDYVYEHGGIYSFELAEEFSRINSGNEKVEYINEISSAKNGGYRWNYGNMFYVDLVNRYLQELHEERAAANES
ncbi:lysozyme family protein [Ileibacterium valens]|uniref:lysozyme family protein n=1 Tax=Ileibacterium valens TaxID=1862668 RepID=UPI00257273D1|nr:lysozyme family protein [Ileibacterium valens]